MAKTKKLGDLVNQTVTLLAPLSGTANLVDPLNFSITKANTTTDGYVSKEDWNIFKNKQDALGFTPYNATNPDGYISGITSGMVTTALGFTPYDSANPSGYITSSALTPYATIANPTFTTAITTPIVNGVSGNLAFANAVQTSGAITAFTFTKPNNTTQTASTSISGFVVNGGTRQWNTGNIGTQSENVWGATTYSFVGASTITNAYGNVFNAPIAGTNCTITNNYSAQFNGRLELTSTSSITLNNGTDSMRISRDAGSLGRLVISRPGNESVESVSFGGGSAEIRIRNNSATISHDGTEFQLVNSAGTKGLGLYSTFGDVFLYGQGANGGLKLFGATRNVLIQNGGTFTDNGFRLDVNGTGRFQNTLTLATGTTTIAPLKLTAGTNLTTPVSGSFEFDGTNLYFTVGSVRKTVTLI